MRRFFSSRLPAVALTALATPSVLWSAPPASHADARAPLAVRAGSSAPVAVRAGSSAPASLTAAAAFRPASSPTAPAADLDALNEEAHRTVTDDGWELALKRIFPDTPRYAAPILFFHGFGANHREFDLSGAQSIARYLAGHGHDVWLLDWRGAGDSESPADGDYLGWDFSYDDHIHRDAPAAVQHVLDVTGEDELLLVGHSLGGAVIYAFLETEPLADHVAGFVSFAGAGLLGTDGSDDHPPSDALLSMLGVFAPLIIDDLKVPIEELGAFIANTPGPLYESFLRWAGYWVWNPRNITVPILHDIFLNACGSSSYNLVQQFSTFAYQYDNFNFAGWTGRADASGYYETHGRVSYAELLPVIHTPALVISGALDRLISPVNVALVFDQLSSQDKTYLELSRANGYSFDYGHMDMVVGTAAPLEVYPVVEAWLSERAQ